jgi:sugar lactone lactonase YvrE
MAVRILSWNMYNFRANLVRRAATVNRILKVVNPAAGPNYDILIVIEPGCIQGLNPGDLAAGDGTLGVFKLLSKLQHRHAGWRVAPPLALCNGAKAETLAVYYNSNTVSFEGPERRVGLTQPWNSATADDGRVYWYDGNGTTLRRAGLAGNAVATQGTGANATALTLDAAANRVFWVDTVAHQLWSSNLLGGGAAAMGVANVYASRLRLDTINQRVYWVDTNSNQIRRVDYNGANHTVITPTLPMGTARLPVDLNLDPEVDILYWSNAAGAHRLQWCNLDGNGNSDFPPVGLNRPDCLTIDFARALLYWVDTGTNTIQSSDLQGASVRNRFNQGGVQPRQLTLHMARKTMYFVDAATNDIWQADMDGQNAASVVAGDVPVDLTMDPAHSTLWWVDTNGNRVRSRVQGGAAANVVAAGTPGHLAVHPGSAWVGQCTFQTAMGAQIHFPQAYQRRPYLARFRDLTVAGPNNTFLLLAAHSPPPNYQTAKKAAQSGKGSANNLDAQRGTARMATIREVTTLRAATEPALIIGDFNCCVMTGVQLAQCSNNGPGHANDSAVVMGFGGGFATHITTRTSLKQPGVNATYAAHTSHAYDHILTVGFTTVNHARLKDVIAEKADRRQAAAVGGAVVAGGGAGLAQANFQTCHDAYWKTTGVSDHLPVEVSVTI